MLYEIYIILIDLRKKIAWFRIWIWIFEILCMRFRHKIMCAELDNSDSKSSIFIAAVAHYASQKYSRKTFQKI